MMDHVVDKMATKIRRRVFDHLFKAVKKTYSWTMHYDCSMDEYYYASIIIDDVRTASGDTTVSTTHGNVTASQDLNEFIGQYAGMHYISLINHRVVLIDFRLTLLVSAAWKGSGVGFKQ